MQLLSRPGPSPDRVSPADWPDLLPSRPLLSSGSAWTGIVLQRYRHPPGNIEGRPVRDHCVVAYLGKPFLIEERLHRSGVQRRWTGSGDISLIPAGEPVNRSLKGRADVVVIHTAPGLVDAVVEEVYGRDPAHVSLVRRLPEADAGLYQLAQILLREAEAQAPGTGLMADLIGRAFALQVLRSHSTLSGPRLEPAAKIASRRVRRVVEFMRENFDRPLHLPELAALAGVSPSKFGQAFRDALGDPPHRFLTALRIERACEMLESTDLSVIEIALRCGFGNATHFATTFRKAMGTAPRSWRATRRFSV